MNCYNTDDDNDYDEEDYGHSSDEDGGSNIHINTTTSQLFQPLDAESRINFIFDEENTQSQGELCSLSLDCRKLEIKLLISPSVHFSQDRACEIEIHR